MILSQCFFNIQIGKHDALGYSKIMKVIAKFFKIFHFNTLKSFFLWHRGRYKSTDQPKNIDCYFDI